MGHISINYPMMEEQLKKKNKIFQPRVAEDSDQEDEERAKENEYFHEEYVLIFALTGSISLRNDILLVDSASSKHMTYYKGSLSCLV